MRPSAGRHSHLPHRSRRAARTTNAKIARSITHSDSHVSTNYVSVYQSLEQHSSGAPLVILSAPTLRRQEDGAPDADAPPPRSGTISFARHQLNAAWSPSLNKRKWRRLLLLRAPCGNPAKTLHAPSLPHPYALCLTWGPLVSPGNKAAAFVAFPSRGLHVAFGAWLHKILAC